MYVSTAELVARTGLSKATIWRMRKRHPDFPKPIVLGGTLVRWVTDEIDAWMLSHRPVQEVGHAD
jgi:predicted DNA-binding transcriptional regulator AlpA